MSFETATKLKSEGAVVVFSGGQDSTTCLGWARNRFAKLRALTFDYGQRHRVEIQSAQNICLKLEIPLTVMKFPEEMLFAQNALTDSAKVIENSQSYPNTFVPLRNLVFFSLAASFAERYEMSHLVVGVCEADYSGYPDCREEFVSSLETSMKLALGNPHRPQIHRPLMNLKKSEIFALAESEGILETVIRESHTCYLGERQKEHPWGWGCGVCPACVLRKTGFEEFLKNKTS